MRTVVCGVSLLVAKMDSVGFPCPLTFVEMSSSEIMDSVCSLTAHPWSTHTDPNSASAHGEKEQRQRLRPAKC